MSQFNLDFKGAQINTAVDRVLNSPGFGAIGSGVDPNGTERAVVGSRRWDDDTGTEWLKRPHVDDDENDVGTGGWFKITELGWVNGEPQG